MLQAPKSYLSSKQAVVGEQIKNAPIKGAVTANPRLQNKTTSQQIGIEQPQAKLSALPTSIKPSFGNIATQGASMAADAVIGAGKAIAGGAIDVGQTVGLAGAGLVRAATNFGVQGVANTYIEKQVREQADKLRSQTLENLRAGTINKDQADAELDRAGDLDKAASFRDTAYQRMVMALSDKDEAGNFDYEETLVSVLSGTATLATLPIPGAGAATKGAVTGIAATGKTMAARQGAKTALGILATGGEVTTKGFSYSTARGLQRVITNIQKQSAQAAVVRYATIKQTENMVLMGGQKVPAIYATTAKLFEKSMNSVPGFRATFDTLAKRGAGSFTAKAAVRDVAIELALRAPMRRENIRFAQETIQAYRDGDWFTSEDKMGAIPASILQASFLLEGGPVGAMVKGMGKLATQTKLATYGEHTLIDAIHKYATSDMKGFTGHATGSIYAAIDELPQEMQAKAWQLVKQLAKTNLRSSTVDAAAYKMVEAYIKAHPNTASKDLKDVWKNMLTWAYHADNTMDIVKALQKSGEGTAVLAKFDKATASALAERIKKAVYSTGKNMKKADYDALDDASKAALLESAKADAKQVIYDAINKNEIWAMNDEVTDAILNAIDNATSRKGLVLAPNVYNAAKAVKTSTRALNKLLGKGAGKNAAEAIRQAARDGYTLVITKNKNPNLLASADEAADVALKSQFAEVDDAIFEQAAQARPFFRQVGSALSSIGMGFEETSAVAYRMTRDNAAEEIGQVTGKSGRDILNKLQQFLEIPDNNKFKDLAHPFERGLKRTATDLRMLNKAEMKHALKEIGYGNLTEDQVQGIRRALINAHLRVPFQTRGLAETLISRSYQLNPFYKHYARVQGAFRYTYNPFFMAQEVTETEILGQAIAGGKPVWLMGVGNLNPQLKAQLDDTIAHMDKAGFFNSSSRIGSTIGDSLMATRYGEAAQDVYIGRVSASILDTQKRSMAGVVLKLAESKNMSVDDVMKYFGSDVEQLVRPIVQYPTSGALNSNFVKALNIAVFPSRYNVKVATIAAQTLAKQPPAVQVLTINKLWEMGNWLRSPEGITWQQDNAKAIGFMRWLTPVGSIEWVFDTLSTPFGKGHQGWGDIGILGGLPFGVISQILESQGIITINTPYVSPETGDIYSKRIPESMKARVASAFMDLLGSTFTYPGRTLGLPGKAAMMRDVAGAISLDTTKSEWNVKEYSNADLPNYDKIRQEIWAERYSVKNGVENINDKPALLTAPKSGLNIPKGKAPMIAPDLGGNISLAEKRRLKEQAQENTKAKSKKPDRIKTTTFPSNLPQ